MKQVTFKVATALKDAGYPQDLSTYQKCYWSHCDDIRLFNYDEVDCLDYWQLCCAAPTYLDVWLWLWREKKIFIDVNKFSIDLNDSRVSTLIYEKQVIFIENDPEESIKNAIEYLCDNNLIK